MNLTRDRIRSIGWAFVLTVCIALTAALTLRVNAVKGQVHQAEQRIVSLQSDIAFLEIEFQTRANQQQLRALNDVEFGYMAPRAEQYIEGERHLAELGKPRAPGAPAPIRVASAVGETERTSFIAMVSPVTGRGADAASPGGSPVAKPAASGDVIGDAIVAASLEQRLARIELSEAGGE